MTNPGDETREIAPPKAAERPPAETVVFDAPRTRLRPSYLALLFSVVAAAGFLAGIGVAAGSRPKPQQPGRMVTAPQVVGPSGAVIRFPDGQLEIPPDALAQPVRIVIRRSTFTDRVRVAPARGASQVYKPGDLAAYSFEPRNLEFLRGVRIVFRLPPGARNGTLFARAGNSIVMLGGVLDPDRETETVTVRDFRFSEEGAR